MDDRQISRPVRRALTFMADNEQNAQNPAPETGMPNAADADIIIRESVSYTPRHAADPGVWERVYRRNGLEVAREVLDDDLETVATEGYIPDSVVKEYDEDKHLFFEGEYRSGLPHGLARIYFDNGKVEVEKTYKFGKLEGTAVVYYENGNTRLETVYENNIRNGMQRKFHPSGAVKEVSTYVNGKREGVAKAYYENGALRSAIPYSGGKAQGLAHLYHETGCLAWEVPYTEGDPEGIAKRYNSRGMLTEEWYYVRGEVICKRNFSPDGSIKTDWDLDSVKRAKIIRHMAATTGQYPVEEHDK